MKLRHLEEWTERRRSLAKAYNQALAECDVECPAEMPWARHVYHLYTLRSKDRNGLQKALLAEGIQTAVHYSEPVHVQPAYSDLGYVRGAFPQAERAASEVLSLPMYPEMNDEQIQRVGQAFDRIFTDKAAGPAR